MLSVVVASIVAAVRADCTWDRYPEYVNFAVNLGGCYECVVSSDEMLVETCRAKCLDDPSCKSFETGPDYGDSFEEEMGHRVNCCIEHVDDQVLQTDEGYLRNWYVNAEDAGECSLDVSLWTTHVPADYDMSPCVQDTSIDTSVCTLVDCCVFDDPNWRAIAQESCGAHSLSDFDGASALAGTSGIVAAMATFAALILA